MDWLSSFNLDALNWTADTTLWAVVGLIVIAIALFMLLKGVIKMLLLAMAVSSAVGLWMFLQKNGFTYLAFVTDSPQPWMVQTLAWGCAGFLLLVFFHGAVWFSQLFSWNGRVGPWGIVTTILMCLLMLWVGMLGVSYYGDICRIRYYHELAEAQVAGRTDMPSKPWFTVMKETMRSSSGASWLQHIDPMENTAQTNLACLIAYGCTFDEPRYTAFYQAQLANRGIPQPTRFLDLFGDKGLRTLVAEGRFVTLLENSRLSTFVQFRNTEEYLLKIL